MTCLDVARGSTAARLTGVAAVVGAGTRRAFDPCQAGCACGRGRTDGGTKMGITAADLMTTNVLTLAPDMSLLEMDTLLFENGVSGAPVVEGRRLIGIASQADIVRAVWQGQHEAYHRSSYYANPFPIPLSALEYISRDGPQLGSRLAEVSVVEVMSRDPQVAHPNDPIEVVADRLVRDQIHRLPITEPDGGALVGIVSSLDLARAVNEFGLKANRASRRVD